MLNIKFRIENTMSRPETACPSGGEDVISQGKFMVSWI
jgi:hypothetical protein